MVRLWVFACAGIVVSVSARADWLVELPTSAMPARHASSPTELVYPRPGLPALVEPGELLVARVRVPAPLMPAPGIQQRRSLRGWSAELVGHGRVVDEGAEHRYAMRVLDVRADGARGLVFRATVRVPPWAAPGTYTFRVDSPGSVVSAASGAVRVLVPGRVPIAARYADHDAHDTWDVDVWLSDESLPTALAGEGVPWLDTRIAARFDPQPELTEPRRRVSSHVFLETAERVELEIPERVDPVEGVTWYPATNVRSAGVRPSIVARIDGLEASHRRAGACRSLLVEAPETTTVDESVALRADGLVAWAFEEDGARYEANPRVRLRWIGVQEVHALSVEDGCTRRGEVAIRVEPALRMGCSAGSDASGILWFLGLLCTIALRRYKPVRNLSNPVQRPPSRP